MDARVSNFEQVACARRYTLTQGAGRGLDIIDCDNGKLRFLLNVSKALDIAQMYHKGQNVSFISQNGLNHRHTAFEDRFEGGMLYTCGLDSVGNREGFETHGSLHTTPAAVTRVVCDEKGITVEAEIVSTAWGGRCPVLCRRVFSAIGSDTLTVSDTLVNKGTYEEKYCLLYHVNLGYPMLDEGARVKADERACIPRTPFAKAEQASRYQIEAPVSGKEETCYFLTLERPEIAVENVRSGKRFSLGWSGGLPHFVLWKNMAQGAYALGLEPSTTELDDRFRYDMIRPGESKAFQLSMRIDELR